MYSSINKIYTNNAIIYRVLLFVVMLVSIVYLFAKAEGFEYDFNDGKPWQHPNLYAPFDFTVQKTNQEVDREKAEIYKNQTLYFSYDSHIVAKVRGDFTQQIQHLDKNDSISKPTLSNLTLTANSIIDKVYKNGFLNLENPKIKDVSELICLVKSNWTENIPYSKLILPKDISKIITQNLGQQPYSYWQKKLLTILSNLLKPNVFFDQKHTQKSIDDLLKNISHFGEKISEGELIISKSEVVNAKKYRILNSLKDEFESKVWTVNSGWRTLGYFILISLTLLILFLFLKKYHPKIYDDNLKITFLCLNVLLVILIQTLTVKYNPDYIYVVPLTILPIVLKAFFDTRLVLFTHTLTILLLGFVVPNSFEFIYLHIIAGIIAVLTVSDLYKRATLFISIGQITLGYMLTYFVFSILKQGDTSQLNWFYFILFSINGLLSFLSLVLIYLYEKIFGLVSDVTLLELSNTNSKLLRDLNEKAPGTFQHSMQVANISEAAANEIGANSMLVRVGALYHDIGKMLSPMYFTENQYTGVNPHDDLSPKDSANIIIGHVIKGIELARKNKLPDRIIDFIRTHHGTSSVYYFYKKEQESNLQSEVDISDFQYKGPIPFSKETAILMMCDACEAASKSLKTPTAQSIDSLIDKIIEKQKDDNQFLNSDITFREIEKIKKVIKKKLINIYQLRIEYPE